MSGIQIKGLTKRFGDVTALDNIDLDIADSEFFCVLGPPGAGKTTLLRTIVGLEWPEAGRVLIGGTDVTDLVPSERNVSIVFQNLALYPDKTVYDNLAFPLRQGREKVSSSEIDRRVKETAALLQIEPLLKRRPANLSGGERQRVAIGRCLVRAPLVYLLDEPLSALDALLRLQMRAELKYLQRDLGRTLVYVTHDQVEAMSMADRICVLDRGRVQQVGTPDEVYNRPVNTFVATTVGMPPMNLVPVRVEAANGSLTLRSSSFSYQAPLDPRVEAVSSRDGEELRSVSARRTSVSVPTPRRPTMRCRVIAVEPLGGEAIVDLDLDGRIVKAMTGPDVRIEPDELLPVDFDVVPHPPLRHGRRDRCTRRPEQLPSRRRPDLGSPCDAERGHERGRLLRPRRQRVRRDGGNERRRARVRPPAGRRVERSSCSSTTTPSWCGRRQRRPAASPSSVTRLPRTPPRKRSRQLTIRGGRVDVLVHCDMIHKRIALEDTDMSEWDAITAVNLRGAFAFARVALRTMSTYGRGAIVLVTPLAGLHGRFPAPRRSRRRRQAPTA